MLAANDWYNNFHDLGKPKSHYNLGVLYKLAGKKEQALAQLETAARLDPNSTAAHTGLANVYQVLGDFDEAVAEYEAALRIDEKNADAWNTFGPPANFAAKLRSGPRLRFPFSLPIRSVVPGAKAWSISVSALPA